MGADADGSMSLSDNGLRYRPEIDGLRAIAVLAVVLYHAELGLQGGYIGVDIFFVISGFLITSLIIKDLAKGTFRLTGFWERRIRRIMPAMVLMVVATLVGGWFLLLPRDYSELGKSSAYQTVFGANIYFWRTTGYFAGPAEEMPLLHTWSLAVEEQFYLFIPLILTGLFKYRSLCTRPVMTSLVLGGIVLSLGASISATYRAPSSAFFLMQNRAWELLVGSFMAIVPTSWVPERRSLREVIAWAGLFGILIPCCLYTKATRFPGLAAIPPCLGTAAVVWVTSQNESCSSTRDLLSRVLSAPPLVFVGMISYSLYLWHWPLLAFSRNWLLAAASVSHRLELVALAFCLAIISWRFVEKPFRKKIYCPTRCSVFVFAAVSIAFVFILGSSVRLSRGFSSRLSDQARRYMDARYDHSFNHELSTKDAQNGAFIRIGSAAPDAPVSVLVWGDSHAMAVMAAFDDVLKENGVAGLQATSSTVAPVLDAQWRTGFGIPDPKAFNDAVYRHIVSGKIRDVFLVARWEGYHDSIAEVPLDKALLSTVQRLAKTGVRPWVMLQVPRPRFNVPRELARQQMLPRDLSQLCESPGQWNGLRGNEQTLLDKIEAAGGRILNPRDLFLDSKHKRYVVEKDGVVLYYDDNHLTSAGARKILTPFLEEQLKGCVGRREKRASSPKADLEGVNGLGNKGG